MRILSIIAILVLVAGCGIKQKPKRDMVVEHRQEILARCSEIPDAPFQAQLVNIVIAPENYDNVQIFYTTTLLHQDIIAFYEQQMERLGWQLFAQSKLRDTFLLYTKPEKFCAIMILQDSFSIYVGNK